MEKILTTSEIEEKVYTNYKVKRIDDAIASLDNSYLIYSNLIKKGINPVTKKVVKEEDRKKLLDRLKKDYTIKKDRLESKKIDAKYALTYKETKKDEKKDEINEISDRKEIINKRKIKARNFIITSLFGINIALFALGFDYIKKSNDKATLNGITKEYNNDINNAVSESYHYKFQNSDVNEGTITFVSDEEKSNYPVEYLNHEIIANTIENSNNPDLALFTLYKDFGTSDIPAYSEITSKTCEELDFIYNGEQIKCDFNEYLRLNGFNNKDEYFESCKEELLKGSDTKLDNLKVYVKKMTE